MKKLFIMLWLCSALLSGQGTAQDSKTVTQGPLPLRFHQAIERELSGGQRHTYQVELKGNEFLNVEVDQLNIDVLVTLSAPDGRTLIEMDSQGGRLWRETLSCVAPVTGKYQLIVQALDNQAPTGRYTVRVTELRVAAERDGKRLGAEKALSEGRRLFEQGGTSMALAVSKYQEAIALWRELGERYWEAVTLTNLGWAGTFLPNTGDVIAAHTSAIAVYQEMKDRTGEGRSLGGLGTVYAVMGQYEKALGYYEQALVIRREERDRKGQGGVLANLGNVYERMRQYEKARDYDEQALALQREFKDRKTEGVTLGNLGNIYADLRQYEKARDYYERAIEVLREVKNRSNEANSLAGLGYVFYQLGQYEKARDYYMQARELAHDVKDSVDEVHSLAGLGVSYSQLRQYQKAIDCYELALPLERELKDRVEEGNTLFYLGNTHHALSQYAQARDYYELALALKRELKDRAGEGDALNGLGNAQFHLSQYAKARYYFGQALAIRIEVNDRGGQLKALQGLGAAYDFLSQYEKAREFFEQALAIARELKDQSGEGDAVGNLGNVYLQLGRIEQASSYLEQSLALKREVKDRRGEGDALMDLGNVYSRLSHYEKALNCYGQSLVIKREEKDRKGEAASLGNLGSIYELLSQYEKARDYNEQALAIERELNDRGDEGGLLNNLGRVYSELGDYRKGLDYYRQALEIRHAANDRNGQSETISNLADLSRRLGRYDDARTTFERALAIKVEVKDRDAEAIILNNLGLVYADMGKYEQARDYDERALAIMREVKDRSGEGRALNTLMLLWRKQEKPRLAIFYGKQAVNALQEIRSNIRSLEKESQKSFLAANEAIYRTLANILIETGRLPEAEQVLALLKAEEYSGLLRRGSAPNDEVSYSRAEAETVRIQNELADVGRERSNLLNLSDKQGLDENGKQRLNQIERELIPKANAEFRVALDAISKEAPDVAAKTAEVKEAQSLMRYLRELGPGTVALYTVISTEKDHIDKGWIILVTPDFRKAYAIDVKDLGQTVASFRQALSSPSYDPQPLAQRLYGMLFLNPQPQGPTLAEDLQVYLHDQRDKTLMWSLDGVLRYVPMAALHDGQKYLVERYRNVVFTTASLAGLTHAVSRDWKALGLGVSKSYPGFEALAGARRELAAVIRDAGNKSAGGVLPGTTKIDDQFTEKALMDGLREGFQVVHIASHFSYQPANPTDSFLLLGDGSHLETSKFEDSANIFEKTELLTLSACDTANGSNMKDANGKDSEGLAYVSQKLGAQSVIASLWPVDDVGTQVLMPLFYRLRLTGLTKAEAFQRAQLALLHGDVKDVPGVTRSSQVVSESKNGSALSHYTIDPQRPFAHPFYWAPFVLIGNWR